MAHRVPKKVYIYKMRQGEGGEGDSELDESIESPASVSSPFTPSPATPEGEKPEAMAHTFPRVPGRVEENAESASLHGVRASLGHGMERAAAPVTAYSTSIISEVDRGQEVQNRPEVPGAIANPARPHVAQETIDLTSDDARNRAGQRNVQSMVASSDIKLSQYHGRTNEISLIRNPRCEIHGDMHQPSVASDEREQEAGANVLVGERYEDHTGRGVQAPSFGFHGDASRGYHGNRVPARGTDMRVAISAIPTSIANQRTLNAVPHVRYDYQGNHANRLGSLREAGHLPRSATDYPERRCDPNGPVTDNTNFRIGSDSFNIPSPTSLRRKRITPYDNHVQSQQNDASQQRAPPAHCSTAASLVSNASRNPATGSVSCFAQTVVSFSPFDEVDFVLTRRELVRQASDNQGIHDPSSGSYSHTQSSLATLSSAAVAQLQHSFKSDTVTQRCGPNSGLPSSNHSNRLFATAASSSSQNHFNPAETVTISTRSYDQPVRQAHEQSENSAFIPHANVNMSNRPSGTNIPESPGSSSGYSTNGSVDSPRDLVLNQNDPPARTPRHSLDHLSIQSPPHHRSHDLSPDIPMNQSESSNSTNVRQTDQPAPLAHESHTSQQSAPMPDLQMAPREVPTEGTKNDQGTVKMEASQQLKSDLQPSDSQQHVKAHSTEEASEARMLVDSSCGEPIQGRRRTSDGGVDGRSRRKSGMGTKELHACQVCGEVAAGFHCGAYICEACKKFFLRCLKHEQSRFTCNNDGKCEITKENRVRCQYCRYQRCLELGMYKPGGEEDKALDVDFSKIPCKVCGAPSSGYHFGSITCEGCKGFFRRTLREAKSLPGACSRGGNCNLGCMTRNVCKACRWQKCLEIGMTPEGSRIGRQPNSVKRNTLLQHKHLQAAKFPELGGPHIKEEPMDAEYSNSQQGNLMMSGGMMPPKLDLAGMELQEVSPPEGLEEGGHGKRVPGNPGEGHPMGDVAGSGANLPKQPKMARFEETSCDGMYGSSRRSDNGIPLGSQLSRGQSVDEPIPDLTHVDDVEDMHDEEGAGGPPAIDRYDTRPTDRSTSMPPRQDSFLSSSKMDKPPGMPFKPEGFPGGLPFPAAFGQGMPADMSSLPSMMSMLPQMASMLPPGMASSMMSMMPGMSPGDGPGPSGLRAGMPPPAGGGLPDLSNMGEINMFDQMVTACVKAAEAIPQAKDLSLVPATMLHTEEASVIEQLSKSFSELESVTYRSPEFVQLCQGMVEGKVPAFMVINYSFSHHAAKLLSFAKSVAGFKKMQLEDKILLMKRCIYPIILQIHSCRYNLKTQEYAFFNCYPDEREALFNQYPEFRVVERHFHLCGRILQEMRLDKACNGLLSACLLFCWEDKEVKAPSEVKKNYNYYMNILLDVYQRLQPQVDREKVKTTLESLLSDLAHFNDEHTQAAIVVMKRESQHAFQKLWKEIYG